MKKLKALGLIILSTVALAGCVTRNPSYNPSQPVTAANPVYVPDTNKIATVGTTLQGVNTATAPVDPYAPIINLGIEAGLGIATAIAGLIAASKNKQANTANAAAQHLATVLPDNMVDKAINTAPNSAVAASVAAHLNAAPDTGIVAVKAA